MKPDYIYTSVEICQSPKIYGNVCGDVAEVYRDSISTNIVLCDGIGSGLKANLYANMVCSRIINMIKEGSTIKNVFTSVGETMNNAWGKELPFAVFTIVRILDNGNTTVITYDMPLPIFVTRQYSYPVVGREYYWEKAKISEANLHLDKNEGLMIMSDGITQAGLGNGLINGWETKGIVKYINHELSLGFSSFENLTESVHNNAISLWGKKYGDDCSIVTAHNRRGITLNVLTGTPLDKNKDEEFVNDYLNSKGIKIVCGGSTARMLARVDKKTIEISDADSTITPPSFTISGITLATEGMITLNQLYNLLNENVAQYDENNIVLELHDYFLNADKVLFWVGSSPNQGHNILELKQQGIRNRLTIVSLIADKLKSMGKLVLIKSK